MKYKKNNKIGATSLFSSAGIGTLNIKKFDIDLNTSNELIQKRSDIHKFLYPECDSFCGDITDDEIFNNLVKNHQKNNNKILFATPPCQGMSLAGKRDINDPRNLLIVKVVEFIKLTKPEVIFIENVTQIYSTFINIDGQVLLITDYLKKELSDMYKYINFWKVNAKDFNTAQDRKRAIITLSNFPINLPEKSKEISVKKVIGHLPSLNSGESSEIKYHNAPKHNENHIKWMKHTETGKSAHNNIEHFPVKKDGSRIKGFSTTYKRISWDKPAPTITMANGSISSQNNVHPGRKLADNTYSDARVLTLKEIFLLTGLEENFVLPEETSETLIRQIIGECVPPRIFEGILKENIDEIKKAISED